MNVELKLKNTGSEPLEIQKGLLDNLGRMAFWVRRNGDVPQRYAPYATPCLRPEKTTLAPGESTYGSVFLSAGTNGWLIAEPGNYAVTVALDLGEGESVSGNELRLTVLNPPRASRKEKERLAQDYFNGDVGRTLAFGGSKVRTDANDALREVVARFPERNAARHAEVALSLPAAGEYKVVDFEVGGPAKLNVQQPDEAAAQAAKKALIDDAEKTIETLGHIAFKAQVDRLSQKAAERGDATTAAEAQKNLLTVLGKRGVKLPAAVKEGVEKAAADYAKG